MNTNYRIAATLYFLETGFVRYISGNNLHNGGDIDDDILIFILQ
jgi:hypothetical protein